MTLTDVRYLDYGTEKKSGGTYRNVWDGHPRCQSDGNLGCTEGSAKRLLQRQDETEELLPAIPDAWKAESEVKS